MIVVGHEFSNFKILFLFHYYKQLILWFYNEESGMDCEDIFKKV